LSFNLRKEHHSLESRMREIRLSGLGEGAVLSRPYLIRVSWIDAGSERRIIFGSSFQNL